MGESVYMVLCSSGERSTFIGVLRAKHLEQVIAKQTPKHRRSYCTLWAAACYLVFQAL